MSTGQFKLYTTLGGWPEELLRIDDTGSVYVEGELVSHEQLADIIIRGLDAKKGNP